MMTIQRLLLASLLGLVSACGSSGSSDSSDSGGGGEDGGDGGSGPNVSFSFASSTVPEDQDTTEVELRLDQVHDQHIDVGFSLGGNANVGDYWLVSSNPVTIPTGKDFALIELLILEDGEGELDETIQIDLISPDNANLGAVTQHVVTIIDEDELLVDEVEPNNDHLSDQFLGSISSKVSYEVQGSALLGDVDVYGIQVLENNRVFVSMDPASAISQVVINQLDGDGNLVATFDDGISGTTVTTSFDVNAGDKFFLEVYVEVDGTAYVLDIVGV